MRIARSIAPRSIALLLFVLAFSPGFERAAHAAAASIAAGGDRSCAVDSAGAAYCWGDNPGGSLGNGGPILRLAPIPVVGLSSGVAAVATNAAAYHTCAITQAGAAYCWGDGVAGQLGNGSFASSTVPVLVTGLSSGTSAMALGNFHTCAVTQAGAVYCWGDNFWGQLGDGTTTTRTLMRAVSGLASGVRAIAAGTGHTCALTTAGAVLCWGKNDFGQLGNGTTVNASVPVPVAGLASGVSAIAAGFDHTCALRTGGAVLCWGRNDFGQLGDGTTTNSPIPSPVTGLAPGIVGISTGGFHSCAVTQGGGAVCWGDGLSGQLGDGAYESSPTPVAVSGLASGVTAIASGWVHSCALLTNGTSKCWGYDGAGQFADGTQDDSSSPVASSRLTESVVSLVAGEVHTCGLTARGGVLCWGGDMDFQLGDNRPLGLSSPGQVTGLGSGVTAISAGQFFTCALNSAGAVLCWGNDAVGELGTGSYAAATSLPVATKIKTGGKAIAAGSEHACALTNAGGVLCWGLNDYGELGDGTTDRSADPVVVTGLSSPATAIGAGHRHSCALDSSGKVLCWGWNWYGQLGDGTTTDSSVPVAVGGVSAAKALSTGGWHSCAVTAIGGVLCWGDNAFGQLGNGTTTSSTVAVAVTGISSGIASVAAGDEHTCAVTTAGGVLCWGLNNYGQLGDGTTTNSSSPVPVAGLSSGVAAVAAGRNHTCALMAQGNVMCWGYNSAGGLGDSTFAGRTKPVVVAHVGATGTLAANDWFLDLDPALPKAIPPDEVPTYLVSTSGNVATAVVDLTATVQFRHQDVGKSIYIYGYVPTSLLKRGVSSKDGGCELAQIGSSGLPQQANATTLQSYASNVLGAQQQSVSLLDNLLAANSAGSTFCLGTGSTSAESTDPANRRCVATVPSTSGTACQPPDAVARVPGPLSGLWWNPDESGWGIDFTQRRNIVFAAWYTYDGSGNPKWYVASSCAMPAGTTGATGTCKGDLYETKGPAFFGAAFDPSAVSFVTVGSLQIDFRDSSNASMTYVLNGDTRTVSITRQTFGSGTAAPAVDYTDLWWNPTESGWGMAITHRYDVMFLAWFVYDDSGHPVWYVASDCAVSGAGCSGDLYRTTGPPPGPVFDPNQVHHEIAGRVTLSFTDANNGVIDYTVDGISASKRITRQTF